MRASLHAHTVPMHNTCETSGTTVGEAATVGAGSGMEMETLGVAACMGMVATTVRKSETSRTNPCNAIHLHLRFCCSCSRNGVAACSLRENTHWLDTIQKEGIFFTLARWKVASNVRFRTLPCQIFNHYNKCKDIMQRWPQCT
jgi:hypothetical protein